MVVEGPKSLEEALFSGQRVQSVFVLEGWTHPVIDRAVALGAKHFAIDQHVLARVAETETPQPVLAVVERRFGDLESCRALLMSGGFVLVAVGVGDPGNIGTIIRSAEGAGAAAVILTDGCADPTAPKALRSSAGSLFHVPVIEARLATDVVRTLHSWGVKCFGTSSVVDGGVAPDLLDLTKSFSVLVGNEARGLSSEVLLACDALVTVPTIGRTESLNVAMAATVVAFEAARQRRI